MKGFFRMLKREWVNRRIYQICPEPKTDVFDYIERFHNARRRRCFELAKQKQLLDFPRYDDTPDPQNEACSNASGLTPPRWLCRRCRL